jgi:hypothetical protein
MFLYYEMLHCWKAMQSKEKRWILDDPLINKNQKLDDPHVNQNNLMNQKNQTNKMNQMNQMYQMNKINYVCPFFI